MAWTSQKPQETAPADATPTPRRYRCRLDSVGDVKRELAKLYRESRSQMIPIESASKLAHVLSTLSRTIEGSLLEDRIDALEAKAGR